MSHAVVVLPTTEPEQLLPAEMLGEDMVVVAVDGGLALARACGLRVGLIVGDLDSVDPDLLAEASRRGVEVQRHPTAKEHTDLELALDLPAVRTATAVTVVGGGGGRLDHLLGNLAALAGAVSRPGGPESIDAWMGTARVVAVRRRWVASVAPGTTVSLVPWGAPARVRTSGLRWPLHDEVLDPERARGVSNVVTEAGLVEVTAGGGVLFVVFPAVDRSGTDAMTIVRTADRPPTEEEH